MMDWLDGLWSRSLCGNADRIIIIIIGEKESLPFNVRNVGGGGSRQGPFPNNANTNKNTVQYGLLYVSNAPPK